jgi:hypothetical protein
MSGNQDTAPDLWRLDDNDRLLLRAALGPAQAAAEAYLSWRRRVPLDDIGVAAFRLLPGLIQTALQQGVEDSELPRIRGVIRHTWLANQLRIHTLHQALDAFAAAGIEAMVLKGAALFARYPHLVAARSTGDYDLLVRRSDAPRAVQCLVASGFRPRVVRVDHFAPEDFDLIHAYPFAKAGGRSDDGLDLHWQALPFDVGGGDYTDDLFAHAEDARLGGRTIRVPGLADHLALTVCRPTSWETGEIVLRAAEAGFLLRGCAGELDWDRFVTLTRRFGHEAKARRVLELVSEAGGPTAPASVMGRLDGRNRLHAVLATAWRARPPAATARARNVLRAADHAVRSGLQTMRSSGRGHAIARDDRGLVGIWRTHAARPVAFHNDAPRYITGFSLPETEGRWTDGKVAVLAVPVAPAIIGPLTLHLTALPFCTPGADSFTFDSCVGPNTCQRHVIRFDEGVPACVVIPGATVLPSPHRIVLVLRLLDAGTPQFFGLSDDIRELGLMLQRMKLFDGTSVIEAIELALPPLDIDVTG